MARLAVVGAGMMGEALAAGLVEHGWSPAQLVLTDVRRQHLEMVGKRLGVPTAGDNREAAADAEAILLAVKPQDAPRAMETLRDVAANRPILSIVAGLRTSAIEDALGGAPAVVRAMPNTPARVGKGVTALARGSAATDAARELATEVFAAVGPVVWVSEDQLDAVTALSGSGPAYVFLIAEALVEAGVALGLPRDVASTLTFATVEGAGRMLVETGEHPAVLRGQVTSPAGTTAAALGVLERRAVRAAVVDAVRAAYERSRELAEAASDR